VCKEDKTKLPDFVQIIQASVNGKLYRWVEHSDFLVGNAATDLRDVIGLIPASSAIHSCERVSKSGLHLPKLW